MLAVEGGHVAAVEHDRRGAALPSVTLPVLSLARVGRWIVPRLSTEVLASHAVLHDLVTGQGDVAGGDWISPLLVTLPATAPALKRNDFAAEGGGQRIARGARALADVETVAGRQHGLALGGVDVAVVLHFLPSSKA
jgi:hypothetical protein